MMDDLRSLYEGSIRAHKRHIDELKSKNRELVDTNVTLTRKVDELDRLVESAKQANDDLHQAFEGLRQENLRLQESPNQQQIVPIQEIYQAEKQELVQAIDQAQGNYINLARESVSWLTDKDNLNRKVKFLERECDRYERDNKTLGKQVRHLVKTLEEERGMIIRRATHANEAENSNRLGRTINSLDVIDNNLVTFESIEELQLQNQKLLSLVKDLSEREEKRETEIENEDTKRLTSEIETLKTQLDSVKEDRERIMTAFNTISKERDLFNILLSKTRQAEHMTPQIFQRMVEIACSHRPAISGGEPVDTQDKDAHIADLKAMISKLEGEIERLKQDYTESRTKSEDEIRLKTELLAKAHLRIQEETKRAEVANERNLVLESNIESIQSEFDDLRTKNQKTIFEKQQLEKENDDLKANLEEEKRRRQEELSSILNEIQTKSELRFQMQERLHLAETTNRELEVQYQLATEKLEQKEEELNNLRAQYNNSHQELELQCQSITEKLRQKELELESLRSEQAASNQELEVQRQAIAESIQQKDQEIERLRSHQCSSDQELEAQSLAEKLRQKELELENLRSSQIATHEELNNLRSNQTASHKELEDQCQSITEQLRRKELECEKLRSHFEVMQGLRSLERDSRLEIARAYSKLQGNRKQHNKQPRLQPAAEQQPEPTQQQVAQPAPQSEIANEPQPPLQSNPQPSKHIVLKRRKIIQ